MKNLNIKKALNTVLLTGLVSISLIECKKDELEKSQDSSNNTTITYNSLADFFRKNGVQSQTLTINSSTGGTFTSPQGTVVTIPANAFVTSGGTPVTGDVKIEFKDVYKKSDMLLSDIPTQTASGILKSAGEFFIKATVGESPVELANGKKITVEQPAMGKAIDTAMAPFAFNADADAWKPIAVDTFSFTPNMKAVDSIKFPSPFQAQNYVYELYHFQSPTDKGSWCNSDNSEYFSSYSQTNFTVHTNVSTTDYETNVFLVFSGINSMVHVYSDWNTISNFPYSYAPIGLKCTVVALAVKDNKLYSSFTPTTITANQTINVGVTETTTEAFKTALKALD